MISPFKNKHKTRLPAIAPVSVFWANTPATSNQQLVTSNQQPVTRNN